MRLGRGIPVVLSGLALMCCTKATVDSEEALAARAAGDTAAKGRGPAATGSPLAAACRVMQLSGSAVDHLGREVRRGQALAGPSWLALSKDAVLQIKHTRSGRELALQGPGRMLVCPEGEEQVVLGSGTVRTQAGTGVRPGAWVSVATPFGVVSYANARAELEAGDTLWVQSHAGGLRWLAPPQPERTLELGQRHQFERASSFRDASRRCASMKQRASQEQARVLAHRGPGLGVLASRHVATQKEAQVSCLWAQACALREHEGARLTQALVETAPPSL